MPCEHVRHEARLSGRDESGQFRTRVAQCYPEAMNRQLAKAHADRMLSVGPRSSSKGRPSADTVAAALREAARERQEQREDELPLTFLRQLG